MKYIFVLLTVANTLYANANTLKVNSMADSTVADGSDVYTLRKAIHKAQAGDTIAFEVTCVELGDSINVNKSLTIDGSVNGKQTIVKNTAQGERIFRIIDDSQPIKVKLQNLSLRNANYNKGYQGGAVVYRSNDTLRIDNCTFINCTTTQTNNTQQAKGGAVALLKGTLIVNNSTFVNNKADNGGGAIFTDVNTNCTIVNSTILNNIPDSINGTATVYNSILGSGNTYSLAWTNNDSITARVTNTSFDVDTAGRRVELNIANMDFRISQNGQDRNTHAAQQSVKFYTAGAYVPPSSTDAFLTNVNFNWGTLRTQFTWNNTAYILDSVPYSADLQVTKVNTNHNNASYSIYSTGYKGSNETITVTGRAPDRTTKDYVFNVNRLNQKQTGTLDTLYVQGYDLTPLHNRWLSNRDFKVNVGTADNVTVIAHAWKVAGDRYGTTQVIPDNTNVKVYPYIIKPLAEYGFTVAGLQHGDNNLTVKGIAENGDTTDYYYLNIQRDPGDDNNLLSNLVARTAYNSDNLTLNPNFNDYTFIYNTTMPLGFDYLYLLHNTQSPFATAKLSTANPAKINNDTTIFITVTAQNGKQLLYTLNVTKQLQPQDYYDNSLQSITTSAGTLYPEFNDILYNKYYVNVDYNIPFIRINAVPTQKNATVNLNPQDNIPLQPGENIIYVMVESPNGLADKTITLVVTRYNPTNNTNTQINTTVYAKQNTLVVEAKNVTHVKVVNILGRIVIDKIVQEGSHNFTLQQGTYIVTLDQQAHKIIVK